MANKKAAPAPPKAKAAPKPPREKITANGVTRPADGTTTGKVWATADKLSAKGNPAERSAVMEACEKQNINAATVATQYQLWRVFNGVPKKVAAPKPKVVKKAAAKKTASKKAPPPPQAAAAAATA